MNEANIIKDFSIGNTRIKIADDYCRKNADEVRQMLTDIAERAQRQFIAAASAVSCKKSMDKTADLR
ncbi:MAG: hypothetical protein LUG91_08835 [Ruminococcus sp.]|nr:hypothetical protein [Ruminococcus sp.]